MYKPWRFWSDPGGASPLPSISQTPRSCQCCPFPTSPARTATRRWRHRMSCAWSAPSSISVYRQSRWGCLPATRLTSWFTVHPPCDTEIIIIIIIMYIYHALTNALSAHMIHINLNMIFYTHNIEHSPTKTIYIKYCIQKTHNKNALQTHTHTHTQWL